jgi:hypothetical protein
LFQSVIFADVTCIFSGASGDAPLYKSPFRSQGVLGESFGSLFADAASLLAGFAALGSMPQGWVFVSMGGVRVRPLALTRVCGGPKKFRNGDANWSPEAAWGQEAAVHEKRVHPKPSAPVVFASNICKYTWFWLAERTSSNATKHHIIVTHNVFEMR